MVVTINELTERIAGIVGDRTDDEALQFLEDFDDTVRSLGDGITQEDLDAAVNAKDVEWRERYRERFLRGPEKTEDEGAEETKLEVKTEITNYDDLFTEE